MSRRDEGEEGSWGGKWVGEAFGLKLLDFPLEDTSHRGWWAGAEPAGDLCDVAFGFPQWLTPLPTPAASLHPPHVSAARLSLTHRNRYMNTNGRPVGDSWWEGCWEVYGPPLLCPEEGLKLREGSVLS